MTRAQVLGLMAAQVWREAQILEEVEALRDYRDADLEGEVKKAIHVAELLLKEAERVSPEQVVSVPSVFGGLPRIPEDEAQRVIRYGEPPRRPDPIHVPEGPGYVSPDNS